MVQRYERRTIEEELIAARSQLAADYEQIQSINYQQLTPSNSAQILLNMVNKLSSPAIATQILRTDLFHLEYPYLAQYQMIIDKAEIYYYQSIIQDLTRISNNEAVIQISKQEIRQCVQQLNWKINVQRSSILNESQEVGENMDLMKFFEGVRNYQNWNDNIKREIFTKLKEKSHSIQNQLSFKKGFILSKLERLITSIQGRQMSQIFKIHNKDIRLGRIVQILGRLQHYKQKQYFDLIVKRSKQATVNQHLFDMFSEFIPRKIVGSIRKLAIEIKKKKENISRIIQNIQNIYKKRQIVLKFAVLKRLNLSPMIKASRYTQAIQLVSQASKRYYVRKIINIFNIPIKTIFSRFNQLYLSSIREVFNSIKANDIERRLSRPNVSYRVKGIVLSSLNKYQQEPINAKKIFSKWYLNTHQEKYSKKVYNIWLNGNTNKFTFFMRLKNMVNLMSKKQISKEMKHFVKVLCERYHKYEQHNKKNLLSKWIQKNRRIRKIENMFKLLGTIINETDKTFKKEGIEKLVSYCKRKLIIKQYCNKYMLQHIENVKIALARWKMVNNIKKQWGRRKLRNILLQNTEDIIGTKRQTLSIFKNNLIEGREIKRNCTRKAINKDNVFLQRFIQIWRHNVRNTIVQLDLAKKGAKSNKQKSLLSLQNFAKRIQIYNIRDAMKKFVSNRILRKRRENNLKNNFISIIESNQQYLKRQIFQIFNQNFKQGKFKKQKLVSQLVNANVVKQKIALLIFKNKAMEMTQLLKREKSSKIFELLQGKLKQNYLIFNKRLFTACFLQKIVKNYTTNIALAFNSWKAIPLRIRWKLRRNLISIQNKLGDLMNRRLSFCHNQMKKSLVAGKLKQKKAVYMMACKFQIALKKYFQKYRQYIAIDKEEARIISVSKLFQVANQIQCNNFKHICSTSPMWPKKAAALSNLNNFLNKRMLDYFKNWHKSANALKYFNQIKDQKKKRCLQVFANVIGLAEGRKTRQIIQKFQQNQARRKAKRNLLKKICDSQIIKVLKSFDKWKNLPAPTNQHKVEKAAKFESSLACLVSRNLKVTINALQMSYLKGKEKKLNLARKLVFCFNSQIYLLFNKWRQNKNVKIILDKQKKIEAFFTRLMEQSNPQYTLLMNGQESINKKESLKIIENYWIKQQKRKIKLWQRNTINLRMSDISKKFLLMSLSNIKVKHSNKLLLERIISKFAKNREYIFKQKRRIKINYVSKIIQNYQSNKRLLLNVTMDKLKFNHIKGNFLKNRAFHRFLQQKITQVNRMLALWNNLSNQAKQSHKQKIVPQSFDHFQDAIKKNFYSLFGRTKQSTMKKSCLEKLFHSIESKYKQSFSIWRQTIKQLKILGQLDKQAKGSILERINKIVQATSTQAVTNAIKKFSLNYKTQKVQRRFIERLMQTKSGAVINAFQRWKTIPVANIAGKYKNYQKFYFKMENFYKSRLKFAHSTFSQVSQDATLMKKQSILKLFEMTSLGIRRYYNRWTRLTKQKLILMSVNWALKAFQGGQAALANQYQILFQDERAYKLKIAAIDKIIIATRGTTQNYFNKWKENVREYNISQRMGKEEKKKALQMFNKVMGNSQTGQVLHIIDLFQKNAKIVKVARAFFNRLMGTKTGKILGFFQKLKTIPDAKLNKLKKRGIVFESKLHNFALKRYRDTLLPFKQSTYSASTKKKYCLDRLLRACMGQNHKKFLLWRNINREAKILAHTSLFEKMFNQMQKTYKNNYSILTKDAASETQKKKNVCRKLLNNSLFVQHHAYMIWKEAYHVDDINTKKRQHYYINHLKNLVNVFNNHQNKKIVQTVGVFRKLLDMRNFEEYDFYKNYKNKKCLNFYENIKKIQSNNKSIFINALKTNQAEYILVQKSQKLLEIFQVLQHTTKKNMGYIINTEIQTTLLNKTFTKLCNNSLTNVSRAFNIWREKKQVKNIEEGIKREKKKQMLKMLNSVLIQRKNYLIMEVCNKFNLNFKMSNIKKRALLKILKTKSSLIPSSFSLWKNLPYQQAKKLKNKATKFQNGLLNFMRGQLKAVNDCFRKCHFQGVMKKEQAARTIVRSKLLDLNRLLFRWRKINNENTITNKIITLDRVFTNIQTAFQDNISIFDQCKIQDQRKVHAATSIFNNNVKRLNGFFNLWRSKAKMMKLHQFERLMRSFNPEDYNKNLMRIGLLMIQKAQQMQILKGYINSLWKWKLSSIQASYYTKFINVFKESEELVKLSNILNKKLYQNIHYGFRNILSVGHSRTNRKKEIVEKYLTRKARNYFITFKNNILRSQINIWRSKFTESIKAKILADVLATLFLKPKHNAFNSISNYQQFTNKIDMLAHIFQKYKGYNLRSAYEKIKMEGHGRLMKKCEMAYNNVRQYNLRQSFKVLKDNGNVGKLKEKICKIINKHLYSEAFSRINRRKQRIIKSRLSIILLQTLIQQKIANNIKNAIGHFNKNRVKRLGVDKIIKLMSLHYEQYSKRFIQGCINLHNIGKLLQKFKRGQKLQKILEKQDEQLKKTYLNKMRKKENKWMELAIKKFATRASIRSSPSAIILWRLKTYALNA